MSASALPITIWCYYVGTEGELVGEPFKIRPSQTNDISDVKELVSKYLPVTGLPLLSVRVRRAPNLTIHDSLIEEEVQRAYHSNQLERLRPQDMLSSLGLRGDDLFIIDHVPPWSGDVAPEYHHLIMHAAQRGVVQDTDLRLNNIIKELETHPTIQAIKTCLSRPRRVNREEAISAIDEMSAMIAKPHITKRDDSPVPPPPSPPPASDIIMSAPGGIPEVDNGEYSCSLPELLHLQTIWASDYSLTFDQKSNPKTRYNEPYASAAIFYPLAFALKANPNFSSQFGYTQWPMTFLIEVKKQLYTYRPESDFLLQHGSSVRLIVEVQSVKSQEDRYRMLLQAACFVKFANNHFRMYKEKKNFFLVAVYILASGVADRYIVFQDQNDPGKVKYSAPDQFNLNIQTDLLQLLRELYNLVSWTAATELKSDLQDSLGQVNSLVNGFPNIGSPLPAWETSKRTQTRNQPHNGFDTPPPPFQWGRTLYKHDESFGQIVARDYNSVPSIPDHSEAGTWSSLTRPSSPKLRLVYRQSDILKKNPLVAKRVSRSSRELEILQYLHATPSPSPYIIALESCFAVGSVQYLIFPQLNRVDQNSLLNREIEEPCQSLIKGVAYLHANNIAHLDLKLDNLLYDATGKMTIIDFDIAMRVQDEEEKIEGFRGTPGWTAPEIGHPKGAKQSYSAIKADRWACGLLLQEILMFEPKSRFSSLAERLMAENPNQRPSLVQWGDRLFEARVRGHQGDVDPETPPTKKAKANPVDELRSVAL